MRTADAQTVPYPAIAAFVAFAVIAAPVVLTGTPSWTGFERITDTAGQMAFAQHLAESGRSVPVGNSSFNITIQGLTGNGYPGGGQATLGVMARVIRTDVPWCFQAYQAWAAAMGALALFALLRRVIRSPLMCCIGAAVAIQPNILYDYALVSGIKELTTASLILLVAAILAERLAESAIAAFRACARTGDCRRCRHIQLRRNAMVRSPAARGVRHQPARW